VEHRDRSEDNLDISDLYAEGISSAVKKCEFESQYDGVYYGDDNVCNAESIGVAFPAVEHPCCENGRHPAHSAEVTAVSVYPDPGATASFSFDMCWARLR